MHVHTFRILETFPETPPYAPNNKEWQWCWDKQVQSSLIKPKLEMKKIWTFLSSSSSDIWGTQNCLCFWNQKLYLEMFKEEFVLYLSSAFSTCCFSRNFCPRFQTIPCPYSSLTSLIFCTPCESQMGALKTSQMSVSAPSPTYALNEGE